MNQREAAYLVQRMSLNAMGNKRHNDKEMALNSCYFNKSFTIALSKRSGDSKTPEIHLVGNSVLILDAVSAPIPPANDALHIRCDAR